MYIDAQILKTIAKQAKDNVVDEIVKYLPATFEKYQINTENRVACFLGQGAEESAGFKTLREYWGPTAAQNRYEGRKDLGNVNPGDGKLFMGRGIFQITGRANYETYGKKLGLDLVGNPKLAETGEVSVLIACEYWTSHRLNDLADKMDVEGITKKINGGYNGLEDRKLYTKRAQTVAQKIILTRPVVKAVGDSHPPVAAVTPVVAEPPKPSVAIFRKGDNNDGVKILQISLNHKGYVVDVDGDFGAQTEAAVIQFKKDKKIKPADGVVTVDVYNLIKE